MTCPLPDCSICSRQTSRAGSILAWVWIALALIVIAAACAVCSGCASTPRPPTFFEWAAPKMGPMLDVRVLEWPTEPEVQCYLADSPVIPPDAPWPDEADVFRRTMTPRRAHEDLTQIVRDQGEVIDTLKTCILRLTDRTTKARAQ